MRGEPRAARSAGWCRGRGGTSGAASASPAEAALDVAAMEERGRVERAEPERALRVAQRLAASARACERPRENVVGLHARALALRAAGARERRVEAEAVVDVEECGLQVEPAALGGLEAVDRADERVLLARERRAALRAVEVAEEA